MRQIIIDQFEHLRQHYYHRVAAGPFELATPSVVYSDIVLHLRTTPA